MEVGHTPGMRMPQRHTPSVQDRAAITITITISDNPPAPDNRKGDCCEQGVIRGGCHLRTKVCCVQPL